MPDVEARDPFAGFKFQVIIDGRNDIGFQRVTGLKETSDVMEYREGRDPIWKRPIPGLLNYDPITLSRGATRSDFLLGWRRAVAGYETTGSSPTGGGLGDGLPPPAFRKTVTITLHDKGDKNQGSVRKWEVYKAWPADISQSDLNASASEILIDSMTLRHEGVQWVAGEASTGGSG